MTTTNHTKYTNNKLKKYTNMNLLEAIDELRAEIVNPEMFEKTWGYSIEEYVEKMMAFVAEQKHSK